MRTKSKRQKHSARMRPTNGPGLKTFKSLIPTFGQPSQRQHITVPCRRIIDVRFGAEGVTTLSRLAEDGLLSNVFGYSGCSLFNQMKGNFENYYIAGMTVEWCPSNLRGVTMDLNQKPQGVVGPFLFTDDPDTYSQNGLTDDQRMMCPTYVLKDAHRPFKIHRSNANLYQNGKLSAADTAASNFYYSQGASNPLALASLAFSLKQSTSTAIPNNRYVLGMMVVEWEVVFVSIKATGVSRPLTSIPAPTQVQEEEMKDPSEEQPRRGQEVVNPDPQTELFAKQVRKYLASEAATNSSDDEKIARMIQAASQPTRA